MYMNIKRVVFKKVLSAFVLVFFMASFVASFSVYHPTKIANADVCTAVPVGSNSSYLASMNEYVYVFSSGESSIEVIDSTNYDIVDTIDLEFGSAPIYSTLVGTDLYVLDVNTSGSVYVIDTVTNTITIEIPVGVSPLHATLVGTDLYVINMGSVSVISTLTNTVTNTILTGDGNSSNSILVGTDLYVMTGPGVFDPASIFIIDTTLKVVTNTITDVNIVNLGSGKAVLVGSKLYVSDESLVVIDTNTQTVTGTIASVVNPSDLFLIGSDLYALSPSSGVISILDTATDTVTSTINTGQSTSMVLFGTTIYVLGSDGTVYIVSTTTDSVTGTFLAGESPWSAISIGDNIFIVNVGVGGSSVSVFDTTTNTIIDPCRPILVTAEINEATLILTYDEALDADSVPDVSDFVVNVNGNPVSISNLSISGSTITLTIITPTIYTDVVTVSYIVPASNRTQDETNGNGAPAFTNTPVTNNSTYCGSSIPIDGGSYDLALVGEFLYVSNSSGSLLVFDSGSDALLETISVGTAPVSATLVGDYLYVNDYGAGEVIVIDTTDNSISETIAGTSAAYSSTLVGTDLYVNSPDTNSVYVLDTITNTVTDTLIGFSAPYFSTQVGTDLYVSNSGDGTVSVLDTLTNTISETIAVGTSIFSGTLVGTDLYFGDIGNAEVVVVDTSSNTVTDNITVGVGPTSSTLVGTDLYVNEAGSGNISIIDTTSNTITDTIVTGSTPYVSTLVGLYLYVGTYDANITVIDTTTKALYICGKKLVLNYVAGSNGSIIGDSYQIVNAGSNGTAVTAEGNGDYEFVGWSDDSTENPRTEINVRNNKTLTALFVLGSPASSTGGSSSGTALYRVFINLMSMGKFDDAYRLVVNSPRSFTSEINAVVTFCDNAHFTNFMKKGDVDGKFSQYYQGQVEEISKLQDFVNHLFAYQYTRASGPVDSIFGSMTQGGVKILQSMLNRVMTLEQDLAVDGIVGPFTRAAVNDFCLP